MTVGASQPPDRLKRWHRTKWLLIFLTGAAIGCFALSPWPAEIVSLFCRGLYRHGWLHENRLVNDRRGLNLQNDTAGEKAVTMSTGAEALLSELGEPAFRFFMIHDKNMDGSLDPAEFLGFYRVLSPIQIPQKTKTQTFADLSNTLDIETHFKPLLLNSTTKRLEENSCPNRDYFKGLLQWTRPHRSKTQVPVKDFIDLFWPSEARNLSVGDSYDILFEDTKTATHLRSYPSAANRYYLPNAFGSRAEALMSHLLGAFHPRAFPCTRYEPVGSAGVVKAKNADLVEVAFRVHGEFQLNEPPNYPFWFTPSYFYGHAVIARNLTKVLDFHLGTPPERALNVDMEWLQKTPSSNPMTTTVEVDIGYIPEMELAMKVAASDVKNTKWLKSISRAKAFTVVERHLYPFKKIEYAPFPEAFTRAEKKHKLVHSVVLWGSLDDQSC